MEKSGKIIITLLVIIMLGLVGFGIFVSCTPVGIAFWNGYDASLKAANDNTKYENQKKVEDTCRSMMAQYKADLTNYSTNNALYEEYIAKYNATEDEGLKKQYLEKANEYETFAGQYKIRVNNTAATYNEYIRKNEYIWEDNVPSDIDYSLSYLN